MLINPQRPGDVTGPVRRAADEAQDVLVVYFSGHGQRDPRLRGLYLQVGDTDPDDLPATAIDVQHIRSLILESRARYRILILDCCYSGAALPLMGDGDNESDLQEADGWPSCRPVTPTSTPTRSTSRAGSRSSPGR
ncbi:caspase family protein [Dactylosporangium sp. CA-152071]|uniref:caspase family protein n=1 Tax=Dactylosporangium sp. CA-152071 TaxID=3239933 RepID=UPI003D90382C